jgi:hypothetical protein
VEFPTVEFQEGLPNVDQFDGRQQALLIIDDLMNKADQYVCKLFTNLSHNRYVSVVLITQNLLHKNKFVRTMNLNTHYIIMLKNARDASQVAILTRQMYPGKSQFVVEEHEDIHMLYISSRDPSRDGLYFVYSAITKYPARNDHVTVTHQS